MEWPEWLQQCPKQAVPIQLTQVKEPPSDEELHEKFHYHTRKEIVKLKWNEPSGDIRIQDLFKKAAEYNKERLNQRKDEHQERTVGLIGQPGVGKTTLTKDILCKILEKGWFGPKYMFYLKLRDCQYDVETDLLTFLTCNTIPLQFSNNENRRRAVLDELEKDNDVMIIFDGFDEATFKNIRKSANRYSQEVPEIFIKQILIGNILPKSKKLITSRPRQFYELSLEYRPKFVVNLTGIDRAAQQQLCKYICGERSDEVFQSICDQPDLISYCFIPVLCTLLMHCVKNLLFTPKCNIPKTISNVFVSVLGLFMNDTSHCTLQESIDENYLRKHLKRFSNLAWDLFKNKEYYFSPNQVDTVGFSKNERLGFLNTTLVLKGMQAVMLGGSPKKLMYFTHLLWQELLVAIHLLFFANSEQFKMHILSHLLGSRMEMVTKFLFGLCNKECIKSLNNTFLLDFPNQRCEMLKNWTLNRLKSLDVRYRRDFDDCLPYLSWAHEMNDEEFSRAVADHLATDFRFERPIHPIDITVLQNLLNCRNPQRDDQKGFNIYVNAYFLGDSLKRFLKILKNAHEAQSIKKVNDFES